MAFLLSLYGIKFLIKKHFLAFNTCSGLECNLRPQIYLNLHSFEHFLSLFEKKFEEKTFEGEIFLSIA
jgi:hypothetical protein